MKTKTTSLPSEKPAGKFNPLRRLSHTVALLVLGATLLTSCESDTIQLHTRLQADESVSVGDPILNSEKEVIGTVVSIETAPDEETRTAELTIDSSAVAGKVVRVEGANPIELVSLSVKEGETPTLENDGVVDSKSRTGVMIDQVLPENLTTTKLIYLGAAICIVLLALLFIGKVLVRAGAALALLALSLLVGWIGTGIATPAVASWLEAHPPAALVSGEESDSPITPWINWIPENPDPAWVTFILITCLSYLLLAIVVGFARRNFSRKGA